MFENSDAVTSVDQVKSLKNMFQSHSDREMAAGGVT